MTMPKPAQECIGELHIRGKSQRGIASALRISGNTVSKYLSEDLSTHGTVKMFAHFRLSPYKPSA